MAEDNHSSGKEYLVSIMFSHYDQNNNGALEREELEQVCSQAAIVINLQKYAVKVKVKVTLVQALRLCTGHTAYRESRGIALPFHDHGTRRG
jgi:hypothetical protein